MVPEITPAVVSLCQAEEAVSSELAADPSLSPGEAAAKLYGKRKATGKPSRSADAELAPTSADDLKQALSCGRWGPTRPGELFLRAFHDVLCCLEADPLCGMVSPPLLGSYGSIPLSVIAPLADVIRHVSNVIVRARKEVLFATCSWSPSDAVTLVSDALRELSRRAGERGERVVVKIIFDKAGPRQLVNSHQKLTADTYSAKAIDLPGPEEVPHLDMEVIGMHVPLLGTLHAKFMVVDRQIGIVESNNMEDNSNMEMMTHLEGPIVDSLYDSFLITWHERFEPPLPSRDTPARQGGLATPSQADFHPPPPPSSLGAADQAEYPTGVDTRDEPEMVRDGTGVDTRDQPEIVRDGTDAKAQHHHLLPHNDNDRMAGAGQADFHTAAPSLEGDQAKYPTGVDTRDQQEIVRDGTEAKAQHLLPHNPGDPHYDDTLAGEVTRIQSVYSPREGESRVMAINRHLNDTSKSDIAPTGPELEPGDEFTPYLIHATESFPIAMVSRRPRGVPTNSDAFVPQNEAFLSLIRNAKETIFIQTPDLNAMHLLSAIAAAVRRGVDVTYYVCLGYNDAGEMMPGQGGINESFAAKLCGSLSAEERTRLHIHWYTAKDQSRPISQQYRQRSCHVKLLIADGHVGIQGSGNQDTQSWYHSQEINVMIESAATCAKWREGIERNQNTRRFGKGSLDDGVWKDSDGNQVRGATKPMSPPMSWVKGAVGMVRKMEGKSGFWD